MDQEYNDNPVANYDETVPLLSASRPQTHSISLDPLGLKCLLIQHLSSAWGDRTAEFALYLYLIAYFKDTLLPSSIFGFSTTLTGILMSRWAGSLVDGKNKLVLVRSCILVQKTSALAAYGCFALMMTFPDSSQWSIAAIILFGTLVFCGCILHLSTICISIAIERDWATCITSGSPAVDSSINLAKLNTSLRQINLLCKLLAPLFVSFLTVSGGSNGYTISVRVLAGISIVTMAFELYWIGVVYERFPLLAAEQARKDDMARLASGTVSSTLPHEASLYQGTAASRRPSLPARVWYHLRRLLNAQDWEELIRLPVFLSSVAVSLLYLTVLSFDGTMLGYLKTLYFTDDFLAEMRGLCVLTGLLGTMLALPLERKVGLVRAGNWSIWSMVFSLVPVIAAFYLSGVRNPNPDPSHPGFGPFGASLLFGGMALSRIGLWSFDLIQTKQLQNALTTHPRRNTLTALQFTMQNVADLLKYILTMVLSRPSQFRWAALTSFMSVSMGAIVYVMYVKKERGHIAHIGVDWIRKIL